MHALVTKRVAWCVLLALPSTFPGHALGDDTSHHQRIVFIGEYRRIVVTPEETYRVEADGSVILSNNCANASIDFAVRDVVLGPSLDTVVIAAALGEWCQMPLDLGGRRSLVAASHADGEWRLDGTWGVVLDAEGREFIVPRPWEQVAGCPVTPWWQRFSGELQITESDPAMHELLEQGLAFRDDQALLLAFAVPIDAMRADLADGACRNAPAAE